MVQTRNQILQKNKIGLVAECMDRFMLKQNALLIYENSDLKRDVVELDCNLMSKQQELEINQEYTEQLEVEHQLILDQLRALQREHSQLKQDYQCVIQRNIRLCRKLNRVYSGDDLFYHSSSDTETDEEVRVVRRRLF